MEVALVIFAIFLITYLSVQDEAYEKERIKKGLKVIKVKPLYIFAIVLLLVLVGITFIK